MNEKPRFWYVHDRRGFFAWLMLSIDWFLSVRFILYVCPVSTVRRETPLIQMGLPQLKTPVENDSFLFTKCNVSGRFYFLPLLFETIRVVHKDEMIPDWKPWCLAMIRMMDVSRFSSYCFCSSSVVPGVWIGRFKPGMLSAVLITFRYQTYCWTSYCAFLYVFIKFVSGFLWWVRPE